MTEAQPSRQPLSHVNNVPIVGAASLTTKACGGVLGSPTIERMYTVQSHSLTYQL